MTKKVLLLIAFDQITKWFFANRDFFIGFIHIQAVRNFGLSFALDFGFWRNLCLIFFGLAILSWYFIKYKENKTVRLSFIFIFAGALSNLIDRLLFGFVRDYIDVGLNFTFNFSDLFVTVGLAILIFSNPVKPSKIFGSPIDSGGNIIKE
jgi:signal peptidase II